MKEAELVKAGQLRRGEEEHFHHTLLVVTAVLAVHCTQAPTQNRQTKALTHTEVLQ